MTYTPVNGARPSMLDFAPAVPDTNQMSSDGSFTDVFKGQTQNGGNSEETVKTAKPSDNKKAGEDLRQQKPVKEIKNTETADTPEKVENLDDEAVEAVVEEVTEAVSNVIGQIAEEFGLEPEEVEDIIEKLGFTNLQILIPENLTQVVLEAKGETEPMALVTDENLNNFVNEITEELQTTVENVAAANNITPEAVIETVAEADTEVNTFAETVAQSLNQAEDSDTDNDIKVTFEVNRDKEIRPESRKTEAKPEEEIRVTAKEETPTQIPAERTSNRKDSHQGAGHEPKENVLLQNLTEQVTQSIEATTGETFTYAETRQIMNQVIETIHVSVKPETSDINMLLHPESLGTVSVHLSSKDGVVTAQFTTQNEAVKNILEAQMVELKETFNNQGVKVETIEVQVQTNAFAQEYENSRDRGGNPEESRNGRRIRRINLGSAEEMPEELSEEENLAVSMMEANGSTVDYMA